MEGIAGIVIAIILTGLIVSGIGVNKKRLDKDIGNYYKKSIEIDKAAEIIHNIEIDNIVGVLQDVKLIDEMKGSSLSEEIKKLEVKILKDLKNSLEDCHMIGERDEKINKYLEEIKEVEVFVTDEEDSSKVPKVKVLPPILYKDKIFNIVIGKEYIKVNELTRTYDLERSEQGNYEKKDYKNQIGIINTRYIRR